MINFNRITVPMVVSEGLIIVVGMIWRSHNEIGNKTGHNRRL